jgi:chloride channel protein, CIC family
MLATSLTIGIGGSGGVFAPSLFIGAMAGTAFGMAMQAAFPHLGIAPGAYGLVGMAAAFAGAGHAPIAALVIVFELTGEYSIILPLMTAVGAGRRASRPPGGACAPGGRPLRGSPRIRQRRLPGRVTAATLDDPWPTHEDEPRAADFTATLPALRPDATLRTAALALQSHDATGLPVAPADTTEPIGWLDHRDVLAALTPDDHQA